MKPLVLLIGDTGPARALEGSLVKAGCSVETAPDGFFATLVLERNHPVAVVVPYELDDMPAGELGAILAEDPNLADVRRVLVGVPADVYGGAAGDELRMVFHLVVSETVTDSPLADEVSSFLVPLGGTANAEGLRGNLEAVDFPELIQLLAGSGDAGVLLLSLPEGRAGGSGQAHLYFDRGEIVHCAAGDEIGERAFDVVLDAALGGPADFRYQRLSREEIFRLPKSLHGRADRLLLSAVARRDARRWEPLSEVDEERCSSV